MVGGAFNRDQSLVVFDSYASNLVPGDTNRTLDVFVKNLSTGAISRVSESTSGKQGDLESYGGILSPDGRRVAFSSSASTLSPRATGPASAMYIKDLRSAKLRFIPGVGNAWTMDPQWRRVAVSDMRGTTGQNFTHVYLLTIGSTRARLVSVTKSGDQATDLDRCGNRQAGESSSRPTGLT